MPEVLAAFIAFVAEHRRCGDLEGGLEGGMVWLRCSCAALIGHPAESSPEAGGPGQD